MTSPGDARHAKRLVAVGIGITGIEHLQAARDTIASVREVDADIPIVVGGQAVLSPELASMLDATDWAPDGRAAVEVIGRLAGSAAPRRAAQR